MACAASRKQKKIVVRAASDLSALRVMHDFRGVSPRRAAVIIDR